MAFVLVAASGMVSAYASGSSGTKKAKVQTITEGVCIGSVDVGGMTKEEAKELFGKMMLIANGFGISIIEKKDSLNDYFPMNK